MFFPPCRITNFSSPHVFVTEECFFRSADIDMTYFEEAIDFLIDHPQIESKKGIGVYGISKGAEIALGMASTISPSKLGAIAPINGTIYSCMMPIKYKGKIITEGEVKTISIF